MKIDPCIHSDWKEFKVIRRFKGKKLNIKIENKNGIEKGVRKIVINGNEINGNLIPDKLIKENNDIIVIMSR